MRIKKNCLIMHMLFMTDKIKDKKAKKQAQLLSVVELF